MGVAQSKQERRDSDVTASDSAKGFISGSTADKGSELMQHFADGKGGEDLIIEIQRAQNQAIEQLRKSLDKLVATCRKTERRLLQGLEKIFDSWNEICKESKEVCYEVRMWNEELVNWIENWQRRAQVTEIDSNLSLWLNQLHLPQQDTDLLMKTFQERGITRPMDLLIDETESERMFNIMTITPVTLTKLKRALESLPRHKAQTEECLARLEQAVHRGTELLHLMGKTSQKFVNLQTQINELIASETKHAKKVAYCEIGVAALGISITAALIGTCVALTVCCGVGILEAVVVIPVAVSLCSSAIVAARLSFEAYQTLQQMRKTTLWSNDLLVRVANEVEIENCQWSASEHALSELIKKTQTDRDHLKKQGSEDMAEFQDTTAKLITHYRETAEKFKAFEDIIEGEMRLALHTTFFDLQHTKIKGEAQPSCLCS